MDRWGRMALIEEWYRRYAPQLYRYAGAFLDPGGAEETVQETFRVVCESGEVEKVRFPQAWLREIARNIIRNRLRALMQQRRRFVDPEDLGEEDWGAEEDERSIALEYAGLLPPEELRLLELLFGGYTYAGAARELGITEGACRKRCCRALERLRRRLGAGEEKPAPPGEKGEEVHHV